MFKVFSPAGELITTKSVKEFADRFQFNPSSARALKNGKRARIRGWCSTHRKAKRHRERFLTKLVNLRTGEECILGQSIRAFAKNHDLCMNELWKLVNGYGKIAYRGWVTQATRDVCLAGNIF